MGLKFAPRPTTPTPPRQPRPRRAPRPFTPIDNPEVWANEHYREWAQALTSGEREALHRYQGSLYREINNSLRQPERYAAEAHRRLARTIRPMERTIRRVPTDVDLVSYRGFTQPVLYDAAPGSLVGQDYVDLGFLSTSLREEFSRSWIQGSNYAILLRVELPRGVRGAYLSAMNDIREYEFLLQRGTRFKITADEFLPGSDPPIRRLTLRAITRERVLALFFEPGGVVMDEPILPEHTANLSPDDTEPAIDPMDATRADKWGYTDEEIFTVMPGLRELLSEDDKPPV